MVAHRLSTARRCDSIIVLERGSVVKFGSDEELLQLGGLYYELQRYQEDE